VAGNLIDIYNDAFSPGVTPPVSPDGLNDLYLSNNGQYRLARDIPEPAALALLGIGLLGLGFSRRRR
jgi:hypothetical protein